MMASEIAQGLVMIDADLRGLKLKLSEGEAATRESAKRMESAFGLIKFAALGTIAMRAFRMLRAEVGRWGEEAAKSSDGVAGAIATMTADVASLRGEMGKAFYEGAGGAMSVWGPMVDVLRDNNKEAGTFASIMGSIVQAAAAMGATVIAIVRGIGQLVRTVIGGIEEAIGDVAITAGNVASKIPGGGKVGEWLTEKGTEAKTRGQVIMDDSMSDTSKVFGDLGERWSRLFQGTMSDRETDRYLRERGSSLGEMRAQAEARAKQATEKPGQTARATSTAREGMVLSSELGGGIPMASVPTIGSGGAVVPPALMTTTMALKAEPATEATLTKLVNVAENIERNTARSASIAR